MDGRCGDHPDEPAAGTCTRCGRSMCVGCVLSSEGVVSFVCAACRLSGDDSSILLSSPSMTEDSATTILGMAPLSPKDELDFPSRPAAGLTEAPSDSLIEERLPLLVPGTARSTLRQRCVRHADVEAIVLCSRCLKPLCSLCAEESPAGMVCDGGCTARVADRGSNRALLVAIAVVAVAIAAVVISPRRASPPSEVALAKGPPPPQTVELEPDLSPVANPKSAKGEPAKPEPPKVVIPELQPPKREAPKIEPPKVEPPKPEPPKPVVVVKPEPPKVEPPKVEPPKPPPPKVEVPKPEPPKVEPPKPPPPKVEVPKPEPPPAPRSSPPKPESEGGKPEPPKVEPPKPVVVAKQEPPKVEPPKPPPPKVEVPKPEPPKPEPRKQSAVEVTLNEAARLIRESTPLYRDVAEGLSGNSVSEAAVPALAGAMKELELKLVTAADLYAAVKGESPDRELLHRRELVLRELVAALREARGQVRLPLLRHEASELMRESAPLYRAFTQDAKAHRAQGELARQKLRRARYCCLRIQSEEPSRSIADRILSLDAMLETLDAALPTPK